MSKRLEVLKKSLEKKEVELQRRLDIHFATVKQANGQPLNDKRNGQATLNKWERQNEGIRSIKKSIEATKRAIEIEECKIRVVDYVNSFIPNEILELVEIGILVQWRKYPNTFFVSGIDKARIIWDGKKKVVAHKYVNQIINQEDRSKFASIYNSLNYKLNAN